jgi:hypothetical protein
MQDNLTIERHHSELHAQNLDPDAFNRWRGCKSTHRLPIYEGKDLYIFRLEGGKSEILDTLTCADITLDFNRGFESCWTREDGSEIFVGHEPVEVDDSLFLWHTFFSEVQYLPYQGKYATRVPMAYRCPHNITMYKVPGVLYLLERKIYDRTFPGV